LLLSSNHDIGIAMDTPRGLVVPVLRRVEQKSLTEIQQELNELREAAMSDQLSKANFDPRPSFTLSNVGSVGGGGTFMHPVIVPPQVATDAIGQIQRLPRFETSSSGNVVAAHVMVTSWAGDHRFLDGATLARFNGSVKRYMENPSLMLLHLK
jgi:2-oxoisovalerate dehydrogenase E2 component (dihydrolipoyl transacylase)